MEHKQGSDAWKQARLGKITASRFRDVLTQPRAKKDREAGKLSQTAQSYLLEVAAEILTGQAEDRLPTWAMTWGKDNEAGARDVYEQLTGQSVQEVGFTEHPSEPMIGGSPDGLVGETGGIEIKCPANTRIHLATVLAGDVPPEHLPQIHGLLLITGRQWWDFVSYDPRIRDIRLAMWTHRIHAKNVDFAPLANALANFQKTLLETLCTLKGDQTDDN